MAEKKELNAELKSANDADIETFRHKATKLQFFSAVIGGIAGSVLFALPTAILIGHLTFTWPLVAIAAAAIVGIGIATKLSLDATVLSQKLSAKLTGAAVNGNALQQQQQQEPQITLPPGMDQPQQEAAAGDKKWADKAGRPGRTPIDDDAKAWAAKMQQQDAAQQTAAKGA